MQEDVEGVKKAFREVDKNNDGRITKDECKEIFLDLFPGCWTVDDLDDLFEAADIDQNGYLDYCEFVDWIYSVEGGEVPEEPSRKQNQNQIQVGGLRFSDDAEVVEAASSASEGPKRNVRCRINTGFEVEKKPGLQFNDKAEQVDAASSAAEGPKRAVRQRINTGFAREDDAPEGGSKKAGGLKFNDDAEELEAASMASDGPKKSTRARINTGFERETAEDKDAPKGKVPQFSDNAEELEAASSATGSGRSVRARVNTGFEKKDVPKGKGLQFDEAAEELEAASEASGGPKKGVRQRINTGFARDEDAPKEPRKPLQFNDAAEELEAASSAAEKGTSVRARINTGFEKKVLPPDESERKGLQFNDAAEELEAASSASSGGKAVRGRVNTGFAKENDAPKEKRAPLNFNDNVEQYDAASEASANSRPARTRVNTGFFTPDNPDDTADGEVKNTGTSSLSFNDTAEYLEAASTGASGQTRKCRSRINTGFILQPDSDEDEEPPPSFQTRMSIKRQSRMSQSRISLRSSLTNGLKQGAHPIHMDAMCHALSLAAEMSPDSAEFRIDEREITDDVEKDKELLTNSLRKNHLFEDLEEEAIEDLMEEMCVYQYEDGDIAIRQGDAGGTHFFVVCQGTFEIVKNEAVVAEIAAGATFGESVLLGDGVRQATVRAKGKAQLYGMLAADVRDMMQMRYEEKYKETMNAVVKVLDSGNCAQLLNLNAFQRHELYTVPTIRQLSAGEVLLNAGPISTDEVYVLVQGSLVMTIDGEDVKNGRVPRYSMIGMEALLFGAMRFSIKADSIVKLLVITRTTLEELLTQSKVPTVLLRPLVDRELSKESQVQNLHEEQRDLLTQSFVIRKITHGESFDVSDVRLLVCLEGEIETSTDGFASNVTKVGAAKDNVVGLDKFFQPDAAWNLQVRAASSSQPAFVAVWHSESMKEVIEECEIGSKVRILKHIFLFRTLSKSQLTTLASAMEMRRYAPDDIVFSQGDIGDTFCIIEKGRVFIEKDGRYIRALGADDYFGERALLTSEPRSATIKASQDCEIWSISSKSFTEALPPAALQYLRGRSELQDAEYKLEDLLFHRVVGTGGFGTVKMVKTASKGIRYALKCIKKKPIVEHKQQQAILNERDVLQNMDHPFIVRLVQTFRNKAYVYFLMELITGGELLDALNSLGGELNKVQTQFYSGSIILALEHLHSRRIAYLDLKSENVMLDHQGYIKLVDFGLAEKVEGGLYGAKGTPHFMAPEMLTSRSPYDTTADLWALGVSCFEFMCGELPFGKDSSNKSEVFGAVLKNEYAFPQSFHEKPHAPEAMSLINGLLCTDPKRRLGGGLAGFKALFEHVFFKGFFWDDLLARRLTPPYVPEGERYAEGQSKDPLAGKKLSEVEEKAEKEELKSGWRDPDPGWDDDFSPGDDDD